MYELLDEMLDNGFPLATESNILKELIKPPNILRTVVNSVTGKTKYVSLIYFLCTSMIVHGSFSWLEVSTKCYKKST